MKALCKFKKLLILFVLSSIMLVGCGAKLDVDAYQSIHEKLLDMKSYSSTITVKYISNKGENEYTLNQKVRKDGKYILTTILPKDLKNHIILYDGSLVWQYNPKLESKISVGDKDKIIRKELSVFAFFENHMKSNDVSVDVSENKEGLHTILEAKVPSSNKFFQSEKLWISNKTKTPEKLIIYDSNNKERIIVTYNDFVYNPELEDSIFNIETLANEPEK